MFTIDLLKGKGLPLKSKPVMVAIAVVPVLIPLLTTTVMAVCCLQNRTVMQTQNNIIQDNQQKTMTYTDDLKLYHSVNNQIAEYQTRLKQIDRALSFRIQMTPLVIELISSLPDSLTITKFDLARNQERKKETDAETGNASYVTAIQRKLKLSVGGTANTTTDQAAEQYVQLLRNSKSLTDLFSDVQIVSRSNGTLDGRNCAFYEIECNLTEQK